MSLSGSGNEFLRVAHLRHDAMLDDIADLAARASGCPIAVIGLIDRERIGLKSLSGQDGRADDVAPCGIALMQDDPWVIDHAAIDPRTLTSPLAAGALGLRFHAALPLRSDDGHDLGTLAVMDRAPRPVSDDQLAMLKKLAGLAVRFLELRLDVRMAECVAERKITSAA